MLSAFFMNFNKQVLIFDLFSSSVTTENINLLQNIVL